MAAIARMLGGLFVAGSLLTAPLVSASDLLDLYQETLGSDPRLQAADAEAEIYQAREKFRRGALLPQANVSAQGSRTVRDSTGATGVDVRDYYYGEKYSFSVTQSLYNKPQWEGYRTAKSEADQYAARFDDTESMITVDLVERYTKVLAAEDNHQFVVAERQAAEKQLSQIEARYKRQMAMITDLLEVEARRDQLLSEELNAENQVELAREAVSELIGRKVDEPLAPLRKEVFIGWDLASPDPWIEKGISSNRGLEAARHAVKAAEAGLRQAQGGRHPSLNVQLLAQQSDIGYDNAPAPETESYVAALNLNMPLFSGGQVSAQVKEARAKLRLSQQQLEEQQRNLSKDIREAFLNARTANKRVEATRKAVASAQKSYEAKQKGLEYGTVTVVDLLDASEQLFGAQRDYRQAYYDLMVQGMHLQRTSGNHAQDKLKEVNDWLDAG